MYTQQQSPVPSLQYNWTGVNSRKIVVRNSEGRVIGNKENGVFIKPVKRSKHFMRCLQSWGLDCKTFDNEIATDCKKIIYADSESGDMLTISTNDFRLHSFKRQFRGYSEQYFVQDKFWHLQGNGQLEFSLV